MSEIDLAVVTVYNILLRIPLTVVSAEIHFKWKIIYDFTLPRAADNWFHCNTENNVDGFYRFIDKGVINILWSIKVV